MQQTLRKTFHAAYHFVRTGLYHLTTDTGTPSKYLVSAAPVPTALAIIALTTQGGNKRSSMELGAKYLEAARLSCGGWGNTPAGPADELATAICSNGLSALEVPQALSYLIYNSACLVAKTWTQDFDRLAPGWLPRQNSPFLQLLQAVAGRPLIPTLETISLKDFKSLSHFMPPYGRPTLLAVTLIKDILRFGLSEETRQAAEELAGWLSPAGSWCEDIMVTSLAVMALYLAGIRESIPRACDWLCSMQYDNGGWPSFNQLINWVVGWAAQLLGEQDPQVLELSTPYLLKALNQDGSLGTTPPFSHPDLDDTAIGLLGLASDPKVLPANLHKSRDLLLKLQNWDGSWSTFPSFCGTPPQCQCDFPIYIKSEDITVHVLRALLKTGCSKQDAPITKGLNWLIKRQHDDGTWDSSWFLGRTYATAQVLDLLLDLEPHANALARGLRYIKSKQQDGHWDTGSAGETGLALYALLKAGMEPTAPAIRQGLDYLVSIQLPDGSFRPCYSGFYASRLYYEEPLSEAMSALRAIGLYLKSTAK